MRKNLEATAYESAPPCSVRLEGEFMERLLLKFCLAANFCKNIIELVTWPDCATSTSSTPFPIVAHPVAGSCWTRGALQTMSGTGYNQSFPYGGQQGGGELGAGEASSFDGNCLTGSPSNVFKALLMADCTPCTFDYISTI